ncbi:hypothetical protein HYPSUDRAFT_208157 [Hypholoma sublateritium FD-334 SS-4]|uniref:Uncharacterized protein n=1 Tax=Hypholoma sublateritium (strain FD-334 SS-4) TaxID=945553 RepID=A0A0D2P3I1_HYPSF|nr:hypothetical protein HYPSUDRAFT_208157 [Hypholoma sublateritium FD-334 SS-4]
MHGQMSRSPAHVPPPTAGLRAPIPAGAYRSGTRTALPHTSLRDVPLSGASNFALEVTTRKTISPTCRAFIQTTSTVRKSQPQRSAIDAYPPHHRFVGLLDPSRFLVAGGR